MRKRLSRLIQCGWFGLLLIGAAIFMAAPDAPAQTGLSGFFTGYGTLNPANNAVGTNSTGGTNTVLSAAVSVPRPELVQLLVTSTVSNATASGQINFVIGRSMDNINWTFHDLVVSNPIPTVFGPLSTNFGNPAVIDMTMFQFFRLNFIENTNGGPFTGATNCIVYYRFQ